MTIRNDIRAQFPNCTVSMTNGTFDYIHHDNQVLERRSLPCIHVAVSSKEYHLDRNDRRIYHHPDPSVIIERLRAAGFCAEFNVNTPGDVSVITSDARPVNIALGLGARWVSL